MVRRVTICYIAGMLKTQIQNVVVEMLELLELSTRQAPFSSGPPQAIKELIRAQQCLQRAKEQLSSQSFPRDSLTTITKYDR